MAMRAVGTPLRMMAGRAAGGRDIRANPPLADQRGHPLGRGYEAGTGTHASGQLATFG
jgi:hypothetical protein